jgi:hypothetical protein
VCSIGGKAKKVKAEPAARDGPGEAGSVLARAWDGHTDDVDRVAHLVGRLQHTLTDEWHLAVRRTILPRYANIEADPSTDAEEVHAEACFAEAIALVAFAAGDATWARLHGLSAQPAAEPTDASTAKPSARPVDAWAASWSRNANRSWLPCVPNVRDGSGLPRDTAGMYGRRMLTIFPFRSLSMVPLEFAFFLDAVKVLYIPVDEIARFSNSFFALPDKTLTRREIESVAEATARALACAY